MQIGSAEIDGQFTGYEQAIQAESADHTDCAEGKPHEGTMDGAARRFVRGGRVTDDFPIRVRGASVRG